MQLLKTLLPSLSVVAAIVAPCHVRADVAHLLPKVKELSVNEGSMPLSSLSIDDPQHTVALERYLKEAGADVTDGKGLPVTVEYVDVIPGVFRHDFSDYPDEEYNLVITADGVRIKAVSTAGVIRAAQTISQLAIDRNGSLPCVEITDWPAFKVRGYMHDVGRSFLEYETLLRHIDLLAHFKINTFHWHLTENQAWRFEVDGYPQLTSDESMTRYPGKYYTQEQCSALAKYAADRGVMVIPEIDMPGHSAAFTRAMGFSMQTDQGIVVLKEALRQLAETFADAPYIHIGADEVSLTYPGFLDIMTKYVQDTLHRKVVVWNPISNFTITDKTGFDMTTTWHPTGRAVTGIPNVDTRYNYANLLDMFADPVGLFRSTIYHEPQGTKDVVGSITALWNDRKMATEEDIVRQNNFYVVALVNSERAWVGGRKQYIEQGGAMLPLAGEEFNDFADWEQRFLLHKNGILKDESIPYVRQTNIRWRITEPMPHGGDVDAVLPPETAEPAKSYQYKGKTYGTRQAVGAAVYLRHSWGDYVKALFKNSPADNVTSYAYTYVYSPVEQTVGAFIEFQTYGRSEVYASPMPGEWDRKGSDIWINDQRIDPPTWIGSTTPGSINHEDLLGNQNFTAREPSRVQLKEGWNKVLIKLPYCHLPNIRLNQWMFTFVLTDLEGKNALDGVIYSPDKLTDENAETLNAVVEETEAWISSMFKDVPGYYDRNMAAGLIALIEEVKGTFNDDLSKEQRDTQIEQLIQERDKLETALASASIIQPRQFTDWGSDMVYYLSTPNRDNRYLTGYGKDAKAKGDGAPSEAAGWIFKERTDSKWDIVNYADGTFLSAQSNFNSPIYTRAGRPDSGWEVKPASELGLVIITSGSAQLNQTNSGLQYDIYNWGNGNNISDTGCQYAFTVADDLIPSSVQEIPGDASGYHDGALYDLTGRRCPDGVATTPGVYISNGRKIVIR